MNLNNRKTSQKQAKQQLANSTNWLKEKPAKNLNPIKTKPILLI